MIIIDLEFYQVEFTGNMYEIRNKLVDHVEVYSETMVNAVGQCMAVNGGLNSLRDQLEDFINEVTN